jgi:hypothetical protein
VAILAPASSGLTAAAAADATATTAGETIAVVAAGPIAEADVPAAVLDSNAVPAAARVITAATPDLRVARSSSAKC